MIRRLLAAAPALVLALLAPLAAAAQDLTPAETARVERIVADAMAKTGTPSVTVAIVRGGRLVYANGWGKASETLPATAALPYQIASNSKQFLAAAMLMLQREGKLRLDDRVAKYVPGITDGDTITLRQLLSHTSGLEDYWPQDYPFAAMYAPVTPRGIVDRWATKPLDFAPGTQWQYSNTGYVVAGLVIEKVTGEPLLAYLQRRILKPLGIAAVDQDLAVGPRYPAGYHRYALGPVRVERPAASGWLFAAGELSMSAPDLAKWDIARMNRTLLDPADWAAQETEVTLADGKGTGYGLGVDVGRDAGGRRFVAHTGGAVGFFTANIVYPDDRAAVTVFTNADFGNAETSIEHAVAAAILPPPAGEEAVMAARARALFDALRAGAIDRRQLTANANAYFTAPALADYAASLSALGEPQSFTPAAHELRGGFAYRAYRVAYPDRTVTIATFAEPGPQGRWEQFLVQPNA